MTTTVFSVKELIEAVASGRVTREAAVAHCNAVIGRPTTSDNKRMRWTRVRDGFAEGETVTVKAAFAAMPKPEPKPQAKPKAQPKADPLTDLARSMTARMDEQSQRMDAMMAAFLALADQMPKRRAAK
jgi:hypothetical protein